jgi:hypothetical protein
MGGIIITPMASTVSASGRPAGARPAEEAQNLEDPLEDPEDPEDPEDGEDGEDLENPETIDGVLSGLLPRERGFVLGLLLSRGTQERREEIARVVSGPCGARCADAIRRANALSREGRLSLIRRLAGEVLGTGADGVGVFAFPDSRLAQALARESTEILRMIATPATPATTAPDGLSLLAMRELERRHPGSPPPPCAVATRDDVIELRRALLAQLQASPAPQWAETEAVTAPQPPPGAPPGPRRRRPPDPNL